MHPLRQIGVVLEADDCVDFGQLRRQIIGVPLCHAAGDEEATDWRRTFRLELCGLDDRRDGLTLRVIDKGAGVDNHNVCLGRIADHPESAALQVAKHHLGVHGVLRAAERDERD